VEAATSSEEAQSEWLDWGLEASQAESSEEEDLEREELIVGPADDYLEQQDAEDERDFVVPMVRTRDGWEIEEGYEDEEGPDLEAEDTDEYSDDVANNARTENAKDDVEDDDDSENDDDTEVGEEGGWD
jgi:hypothetical protein